MATNYKRFLQNQFEKAKSSASEFISSRSDDSRDGFIELNPQVYLDLQVIADMQHTTVEAIVNDILLQYLSSSEQELSPISVDQKEENPLLYLDAICKIKE